MNSVIPENRAAAVQPVENAPGTRADFQALSLGCGLYDLNSRSKLSLTGSDRVRWMNGMITNNVRDLAVGHGVYGFLLNPQGHILADLYAYNRGESLLVDIDRSLLDKVMQLFDHYIIMDDVEVVGLDDNLTAIGLTGPHALQVLRAAGLAVPNLAALQFADLNWNGIALTLVHGDNNAFDTYQVWAGPGNLATLREALMRAGASSVGTSAVELLRVASGIPRYGQDIRERDLPQETEQARALHFSKGCYIGQEIVERIRSRGAVHRKFTGFTGQSPLPAAGAKIQNDGKDVGEITSTASLPVGGGEVLVAMGYIRREVAIPGKQVQAGETQLVVTDLPFAVAKQ